MLVDKMESFFKNESCEASELKKSEASLLGIKIPHFNIKIYTEENVRIMSEVIGGSSAFFGAYTYMNPGGYIRGPVFIGRFCSIGRRVTIGAGMHNMQGLSSSPILRGVKPRSYDSEELSYIRSKKISNKFTIISNDVWIGDGAVVLPGVEVGTGACIAANSVVNKNVKPYEIVGGVPAKSLGFRFEEVLIKKLMNTEWWESDVNFLNSLPIANVFEFIDKFVLQNHSYKTYFLTKD